MKWRSRAALTLVVVVFTSAACSLFVAESPVDTFPSGSVPSTAATTTLPGNPAACLSATGGTGPIDTGSAPTDAFSLSGEIFTCAPDVVVVDEGSLTRALGAAQLAAAYRSPLLLAHPGLVAELERLGAERVHLVAPVEIKTPRGTEIIRHDLDGALAATRELLSTDEVVEPDSPTASVAETILAMHAGDRVTSPTTGLTNPGGGPEELVDRLARDTGSDAVWLVDKTDPMTALIAAAAARPVGAGVVAFDVGDLFRHPVVGTAITGYPDRVVRTVGTSTALDDWKLRTLAGGRQLPGGGFELFPAHIHRRFLAFYGNPSSPGLGAMGQVSPREALSMMSDGGTLTGYVQTGCIPEPCQGTVPPGLLEGYAADGAHVVPTFNYIASVAQPACGSALFPIEDFQEGIDVAAEVGGYVMFDLQPGSQDFLSQAQFYEQALRLPHLGVAIDPEWRCGWPGQTDFDQRGTVTAAEINEVINWVADLVNREALPQKLVLIQQFRLDMIQDRDQLVERPEVEVVIQMDGEGQGNLANKEGTWNQVTEDTADNHWRWGWKNFFVRDHPNGPYSPADTLNREPVPVYISYQ